MSEPSLVISVCVLSRLTPKPGQYRTPLRLNWTGLPSIFFTVTEIVPVPSVRFVNPPPQYNSRLSLRSMGPSKHLSSAKIVNVQPESITMYGSARFLYARAPTRGCEPWSSCTVVRDLRTKNTCAVGSAIWASPSRLDWFGSCACSLLWAGRRGLTGPWLACPTTESTA